MPSVNIQLSIRGWWDGSSQDEEAERRIPIPADREKWVEVHAEQEYTLVVCIIFFKKCILYLTN